VVYGYDSIELNSQANQSTCGAMKNDLALGPDYQLRTLPLGAKLAYL
jgi:hypothetical protein